MSIEDYRPKKLFTVEQANATLPLVRAITADVIKLSREMVDRRQRLDYLRSGRKDSDDLYSAELAQMEDQQQKDQEQLEEFVNELRQIGVEPKTLTEGLIDFPHIMDGRIVFLCWKYDEAEVLHWHEFDAGFDGRQPLALATADE